MNKTELISCFRDTINFAYAAALCHSTENAIKSNKIYKEDFVSKFRTQRNSAGIIVEENTTFAAAKKYLRYGKTAVLNFANPENPGGGVHIGAMAQEECLCRSSNLYACLAANNVSSEYYEYNKSLRSHFYSDRLIYTKGVTVFKNDASVPRQMHEDEWFTVDVITCAAPYLAKRRHINSAVLKELFKSRIKNIFESAIDNAVDVLILGAFGCGAFRNPPEIVARAFHEVIQENEYEKDFCKIIFAIKSTVNSNPFEPCPNIMAFEMEFYGVSSELCKLRFCGSIQECCEDMIIQKGNDKYCGKQFSVLGDSISTLDGFNPRGYKVFYAGDICEKTGVNNMKDTWWGKVIDYFEGELLVNNSWSGSRVTKLPTCDKLFPSGCSDERTSGLHIKSVKPDVIIVYLGTNDWANGVTTAYVDYLDEDLTPECQEFDWAYNSMLKKLKSNYPNAEIWCCTLNSTYISLKPSFKFPHKYAGIHIEEYNEIIRQNARLHNCELIDLYNYGMPYDSLDGSHPTVSGMDTLASMVIGTMDRKQADKNTNFSGANHQFEYVMLDSDITSLLYPNVIKLTIESTGEMVQITKNEFKAGRHVECDLMFDASCRHIARFHATFFFEREMWFVRDNSSINGTWLNGVRLHPGRKYQLAPNDVIDFAHSEKVVFYKTDVSIQSTEDKKIAFQAWNTASAKQEELIGTIIEDRYRILELISHKGCSKMYLILDERCNKQLALKVCDKANSDYHPVIYETFMQEIHMMKRLKHSAIPQIIEVIENHRYLFVIREYVEGVTLESLVTQKGAQSVENVIEWAKQLCNVLLYLHTLNPPHIHRDIKPSNIILMPDGKLKLIDFGTMRQYNALKDQDTCILGSRGYAAPEQYGGSGQTDGRTDIFGLGMTMFCLVTGIKPNEAPHEVRPIRQINQVFPKMLEDIINKCTEINPDKRYQSCEDLLRELNRESKVNGSKGFLSKILGSK